MYVIMMKYYKLYKLEHNKSLRFVDKNNDMKIMTMLGKKLLKKAKERVITGPRHYIPKFYVYSCLEKEEEVIQ